MLSDQVGRLWFHLFLWRWRRRAPLWETVRWQADYKALRQLIRHKYNQVYVTPVESDLTLIRLRYLMRYRKLWGRLLRASRAFDQVLLRYLAFPEDILVDGRLSDHA